VNYVSYFDSIRFVNWLENGQPNGGSGTESGAYTIANGVNEARALNATYFIPTEDEWYKAAYYQPEAQGGDMDSYWGYPTASNAVPIIATANSVGDISNPGANIINYSRGADWNGQDGNLTTVGSAGPLSASFYGTFDQGGNVWEWNETVVGICCQVIRGGDWFGSCFLAAGDWNFVPLSAENFSIGFRIASIPEPSTGLLGPLGIWGFMQLRRKRI